MSAEDNYSDDGDILEEEDIQCCHENYLVTITYNISQFYTFL